MANYLRKLNRNIGRDVLKNKKVPKHLWGNKLKNFSKINEIELDKEKKYINYISIFMSIKKEFIDNEHFEKRFDLNKKEDKWALEKYRTNIKENFYCNNLNLDKLLDTLDNIKAYESAIKVFKSKLELYFKELSNFRPGFIVRVIHSLISNICLETNGVIFGKQFLRGDVFARKRYLEQVDMTLNKLDTTNRFNEIDDLEIRDNIASDDYALLSYFEKLFKIYGNNILGYNLKIVASKYNSFLVKLISDMGLKESENNIIKTSSELVARALEHLVCLMMFEGNAVEIYKKYKTKKEMVEDVLLNSYYIIIFKYYQESNKINSQEEYDKAVKLFKSKITLMKKFDEDLIKAISNININSAYILSRAVHMDKTAYNVIHNIYMSALMEIPMLDKLIIHSAKRLLDTTSENNKLEYKEILDWVSLDVFFYMERLENLVSIESLGELVNGKNLLCRLYYYNYKPEIDFLSFAKNRFKNSRDDEKSYEEIENFLKENKIIKQYKNNIIF